MPQSYPTARETRKLRIAIVGGSVAGVSAVALSSRLPDVHVRLYERAARAREFGTQIALMVTAIKVLRSMLSTAAWDHLQQVLYRGKGTESIHHRHWRTGEVLATAVSPETPRPIQEGRASRPLLHKTLMLDMREGVMQYLSGVVRGEPRRRGGESKEVDLHLKDGSRKVVDLVIAADGLYSLSGLHIKDLPNDSSSFKKGPEVVVLSRLEPGTYSFAAFLQEPGDFANTIPSDIRRVL